MMACQSSRTRPLTLAATSSTSKGYDRSTQGWPFMDPIEHPYECLMCGGILWTDACIQEHVGRHSYEPSPTATDQNQHKQTTSSSLYTKSTRARADKPQPPTRDGPTSHSEPSSDIDAGRPVRTKLHPGGMALTLLHRDKRKRSHVDLVDKVKRADVSTTETHGRTSFADNPVCGKTDQLVKSSSRQADGERLDAKSKYSTASVASTRTSDCKVLYENLFTESPRLDLILQHVDFYGNDVVHLVIKIDADRYEPAVNDTVNIRVMRPKLAWKWTQCGIFVNYNEWKLAGNMYHIELSADYLRQMAKLSLDESATFVAEYLSGRTGYMILAQSIKFYVHPALPETDTSNRVTNSNTHKNDSKHDYNKENNSSSSSSSNNNNNNNNNNNDDTNSHKIANQNSSYQSRPTDYKNKKNSIAANVIPTKNDHGHGKNNTNHNDNIKDVVVNNKDNNSNKIADQNSSNQSRPTDHKNTYSTTVGLVPSRTIAGKSDRDDGKNNTNHNDNNIKNAVNNNNNNANHNNSSNDDNNLSTRAFTGTVVDDKDSSEYEYWEEDEEDMDVETFENDSVGPTDESYMQLKGGRASASLSGQPKSEHLNELVDQPQRLSGNAAVVNVSTTSGSHVDGVTLTRADEVNAKRLVSDQCETSECKSPACEHAMAKLNTRIIELEQERLQLTLVLNNIFHTAAAAQTRVSTALSTASDTALSGSSSQSSLSSRAPAWWWQ